MARVTAALLSLGVVLGGCRNHDYETEHLKITLVGESPTPLCEGDLAAYEHQISLVEQVLGVGLKPGLGVELHQRLIGPDAVTGRFNASKRKITASRLSIAHELVHAVAANLGDPDEFFEEGVAVAFNGRSTLFPTSVSLPSENVGISGRPDYPVAGHFFRWVIAQHGTPAAVDLLRGRSFEAAVGLRIEEQEQEWLANAAWAYPPLDDCPYAPLERAGHGWSDTISLGCDDPEVTTFDGAGSVLREACRSFEVTVAGFYELETDGIGWLRRCFADAVEDPQTIDVARLAVLEGGAYNQAPLPTPTDPAFYEPGAYAICLQQPAEEPPDTLTVVVSPTATTGVRP